MEALVSILRGKLCGTEVHTCAPRVVHHERQTNPPLVSSASEDSDPKQNQDDSHDIRVAFVEYCETTASWNVIVLPVVPTTLLCSMTMLKSPQRKFWR